MERLKRRDTLQSSSAKVEKFVYRGYAAADAPVSVRDVLFACTELAPK